MERKKGWGETKDTSKQVYQVTMATRECGLKFMSPLFQQTGSKWHPSGLTESMHLPECSGLLLENALGIEKEKHQNHSNFFSFSFPIPSKAKTPVSGGTALSSSESVWTKPSRILASSYSPIAENIRLCLTVVSQRSRMPDISSEHLRVLLNPPMFSC